MRDQRHEHLADLLTRHSCRIEPGEKCLIETTDVPAEFIEVLVEAVWRAGGQPFVDAKTEQVRRAVLTGADESYLEELADIELHRMKKMNAFIGVRGYRNPKETGDLPAEKHQNYARLVHAPVHTRQRVAHTKWVVLRYPTPTMAMMAGSSTRAFEDFYYSVTIGVDYGRMQAAMQEAQAFLQRVGSVRISGPGTELSFSVAGIPVVPCYGLRNIPDGEIFTAPLRDSVNGVISYNVPSTYQGFTFRDIRLTFKDGKVVDAQANDSERLKAVLDTDEGARFIGEFALGCNPNILHPMDEPLFDEKICGSFHFTPGASYDAAFNGNRSAVHWDLVCIQRPEYGGGVIEMDGEVVRRDGVFIHPALRGLNPPQGG